MYNYAQPGCTKNKHNSKIFSDFEKCFIELIIGRPLTVPQTYIKTTAYILDIKCN